MKKSDLKPGMIVTYRNGRQREVYLDSYRGLSTRFINSYGHSMSLKDYSDDLTFKEKTDFDIVEVTWKRVEKTPKELEIEAVRVEMEALTKRLKKLFKCLLNI